MEHVTSTAIAVPESPAVNLNALVAGYLAGYQPATRRSYTTDLRDWFGWCRETGLRPLEAQRAHMELYLRQLEELGRSPATISRRITSVGGWYRWLNEEGVLDKNPLARVKRPRVHEESTRLGRERHELVALLDAGKAAGPVEHALLCLLIMNGLRVGEACDARIEDLSSEKGHTVLSIVGKGRKPALIPLVGRCLAAVEAATDGRTRGPILLGTRGAALTRHQAWRVCMLAGKAAEVDGHVHPHQLRHAAVTAALEAGVPLHVVQDMARHADPRTTMRYNRRRHSIEGHATHALDAYLDGEAEAG
jgi:site-specific recombinase XerD